MVVNLSALYNKTIKLYDCQLNPKNIDMKKSPGVYYFEADGPFENQRMHAIMLQTNAGMTSFAAGCILKNCSVFKKDLFAITNSRSEWLFKLNLIINIKINNKKNYYSFG